MENLRSFFQKIYNWLKSFGEKLKGGHNMVRVVIIVGHTSEKGGANNYLGESEFNFNSRIAAQVRDIVNKKYKSFVEVVVLERHSGGFSILEPELRLFRPDCSIELHFNSFSKKAYGCEILAYKDALHAEDTIRLADRITDRMQAVYGFRERNIYQLDDDSVADGVKVLSEGRGVKNLKIVHNCGIPVAMIFEPVFGNFETSESKAFFENEQTYVDFLVDAIGEDVRLFFNKVVK